MCILVCQAFSTTLNDLALLLFANSACWHISDSWKSLSEWIYCWCSDHTVTLILQVANRYLKLQSRIIHCYHIIIFHNHFNSSYMGCCSGHCDRLSIPPFGSLLLTNNLRLWDSLRNCYCRRESCHPRSHTLPRSIQEDTSPLPWLRTALKSAHLFGGYLEISRSLGWDNVSSPSNPDSFSFFPKMFFLGNKKCL